MRLVQVTVPTGKYDAILGVLDDEEIDYVVTDETSGREYTGVIYFPLPTNAVEPVLDALRDAGLGEDAYTVIIDAETVISRRFEALQQKYEEDEENQDRIAREELKARAKDLIPDMNTYLTLTVVSVVVATVGVFLDSPAIVVGSMVIAPLIGPAMATNVGTVLGEQDLFVKGVKLQVIGGVVAIVAATVFAFFVRELSLVPPTTDLLSIFQISSRTRPDILSLAVALGAGVAGALSLSAAVSAALVGVAISIALVPPVAVIGIGIAWGEPIIAAGAGVLVLVNYVGINLAALATLWYSGYRPRDPFLRFSEARRTTLQRLAVLVAAMAVLSVVLGSVTVSSVDAATFEQTVTDEVRAELTASNHPDLTLLDVSVAYDDSVPFRQPERVVVRVGHTNGVPPDELAARIDRRITQETGRDVVVEVQYVRIATA
ncbi:TIGR00341 family protein [Halobacteriaceae archaeon GCM10025711]